MAFTLQQAIHLNLFKDSVILAGKSGLDIPIESIFILDYEYHSFGSSSGISARHRHGLALLGLSLQAEELLRVLKRLILSETCGLVIRTLTREELPWEIISLADSSNFPIILLGLEGEKFENILIELTNYIRDYESLDKCESKVAALVEGTLPRSVVHTLGTELADTVRRPYYSAFCFPRSKQDDKEQKEALRSLKARQPDNVSIHPYKGGILLLLSHLESKRKNLFAPIERILRSEGVDPLDFYIGIGGVQDYLEDMDHGIQESICAALYAKRHQTGLACFESLSFYRLLLPIKDNYWVSRFCGDIVETINNYDEEYGTNLFETLCVYVDHEGNIAKTADSLSVHANTVRYRLQRTKALIGIEAEQHFYAQIYVTVYWNYIRTLDF